MITTRKALDQWRGAGDTEPEQDHQLLRQRLKPPLPGQPKSKITLEDLRKTA
jgi:hypothetical protein